MSCFFQLKKKKIHSIIQGFPVHSNNDCHSPPSFLKNNLFISSGPSSMSLVVPCGFSSCGVWDLSSPKRDQTHVPSIMGQIPNPWVIREVYPKLATEVPLVYHYQFSCSVMSDSLRPHGLQHARLPCLSPIPRPCSNTCPSSRWCHPTISSSVVPFSSCLQSSPASGSFQMSQFSHQVAKVVEFQFQHQSFQWIFRTDFL